MTGPSGDRSRSARDLRVVADLEELERAGAGEIARLARASGPKRPFSIALSGGTTPRGVYSRLVQEPWKGLVPWGSLHVFWGDERLVGADDPDSNYRMARDTLLSKAPIPQANIHPIPTGSGDATVAAERYESDLRTHFRLRAGQEPRFDLVLLGLGADGHVASLFPAGAALRETERLVVAAAAPAGVAARVTVTPPVLLHAAVVVVLVAGDAKAEALARTLAPAGNEAETPARLLLRARGRVTWIADRAAARLCGSGRV